MMKKSSTIKILILLVFCLVLFAPKKAAADPVLCPGGDSSLCPANFTCNPNTNTCVPSSSNPPASPNFQASNPAQSNPSDSHIDFSDCITLSPLALASCTIKIVGIILSALLGLFVAGAAWLLVIILQWNSTIIDLPSVQRGFAISLSFANLGFVLGIIVLALATILRSQTYGIKQLLVKLVVAAIIVNFGLSIAGTIMKVSDSLSLYFLSPFTGSLDNPTGFVNKLIDNFKPQELGLPPDQAHQDAEKYCDDNFSGQLNNFCYITSIAINKTADVGGQLDEFVRVVINLLFVVILSAIITFTLLAIGIMLLIRYVTMGILLIILPLAWLTWIFPKLSSNWNKWWGMFLRWTFFAPLSLFFLYLAILGSTSLPQAKGTTSPDNSPAAAMAVLLNNSGLIALLARVVIVSGLSLGGLFAANSLSIAGSGAAMGMLKGIGGAVQGYVGKQTKKGARLAYQKAGGKEMEKALREGRIGPLAGVPGAKRLASIFGRGLGGVSTNEAMVEEAKRNVPKSWDEAKSNLKGSMNAQDNFAHIALGVKEGKIKANDMVGNMTAKDYMDQMLENGGIERFKQEKLSDDFNKLVGGDKNKRDSEKELMVAEAEAEKVRKESYERNRSEAMSQGYSPQEAEAQATVAAEREANEYLNKKVRVKVAKDVKDESGNYLKDDDGNEFKKGNLVSAIRLLEASQKQFWEKMSSSKGDASRMDVNSLFGPSAFNLERLKETERTIKNITMYAPNVVPNLIKKMNSSTIMEFKERYTKAMDRIVKEYPELIKNLADNTREKLEATRILQRVMLAKESQTKRGGIWRNYFGQAAAEKGEGGGDNAGEKGGESKKA